MARSTITDADLAKVLGKHIKDICDVGYDTASDNHCAHFVSHVMGYHTGAVTCANLSWELRQAARKKGFNGATLRVDDVFKKCPEVGEWDKKKPALKTCLAFITKKSVVDVENKTMGAIPQKHIGIFCSNKIWHYSNSRNKDVSQTEAEFRKHYGSSSKAQETYQVYYGKFPE